MKHSHCLVETDFLIICFNSQLIEMMVLNPNHLFIPVSFKHQEV